MGLCQLKLAEFAKHLHKYKGRVALREDTVEDHNGYRAVCAENSAPASQVAARFLDTVSSKPGITGEASDAVSAHTTVRMSEAPKLLRLSGHGCPQVWIRLPPRRRPTRWGNIEAPLVHLERLVWSPVGRTAFGKTFWEEVCSKAKLGTSLAISLHPSNIRTVLVRVRGRMVGKSEDVGSVWKTLQNDIDLAEPTSLLNQVFLGCTQREAEVDQEAVQSETDLFRHNDDRGVTYTVSSFSLARTTVGITLQSIRVLIR